MAEKRKVIVKINGQDYTVIGEESEEYIKHLAKYVDEKAKEIYGKNDKFSQTMVAMLTAFTITDEYYRTYQELDELKESIVDPLNELEDLRNEVKENREIVETYTNENSEMRKELTKIRERDNSNYKKLIKCQQALKLKEEELETSQKIIGQLQNKLFENQVELVQLRKELDEMMKVYNEK